MNLRVLATCTLILAAILGLTLESHAQLTVNTGTAISMTPLQFVQTYLVGTGVTVSNALYNGSPEPLNSTLRTPLKYRDQIGSFAAAGGALTELGIAGGVLLSTGYTAKAIAPANPNDDMEGNNQPFESDPDLFILANSTINDKSVLEFDFIPQTDVITFRYVFSSIEFDQYCNSSYNDAFGLFLSGPGIAGGAGFTNNAVNIALLPETASYVTIHNVCAADNGNTGHGTYSWWNAAKDYLSYNRITYVFTASYSINCNQTYHMKFAIGDAGDGTWDSGVFLEQNSFTSNSIIGSTSFSNPLTGQYLVEGCGSVTLQYEIPEPHSTNFTIDLAIDPAGTATQADILPNPFPSSVVIPAGSTQAPPIVIQAISDGITEPIENLLINGTTTSCSVTNTLVTELWLKDITPVSVTAAPVTVCNGTPVTLTAAVTGGQPILPSNTFQYVWSTAATSQSITFPPVMGHTNYTVSVTDACSQTAIAPTSVDAGTLPSSAFPVTGPATVCTPSSGIIYSIPVMTGADSYLWTFPAGATIVSGGTTNSVTVDYGLAAVSGTISVKGVNNICGSGTPVNLAVTVAPSPQAAGPVTGITAICTPATAIIYSIPPVTGANTYQWTLPPGATITSGGNTNSITVDFPTLAVSGNISVQGISASCGPGLPSTLPVSIHLSPQAAGTVTGLNTLCTPVTGINYSITPVTGADTYVWTVPGGTTITGGSGTMAITADFSTAAVSGPVTVVPHSNNCGNGASSSLILTIHPTPQAAGPITGPSPVCQGASVLTYSIAPLSFTTSYDWSIPAGVTITGGSGTSQISCVFTTAATSGTFTVRGFNADCNYGVSAVKPVIVNPLPGAAGAITSATGAIVCQGTSGVPYAVPAIANAAGYLWNFTGSGLTLTNNGSNLLVDFSATATSGNLSVTGQNSCGTGPGSALFPVAVNPKPIAEYQVCNDLKTTKNGRPIILKGGLPKGGGSTYSGTGVTQVSPGVYVFDPGNIAVTGGGTVNSIDYDITYRYTNTYSCFDEKTLKVSVFGSNANDPCPGNLKDYRDNQVYPTFLAGTGINARCWTAANLNYGTYTEKLQTQTDNCIQEKYCRNNLAAQCDIFGGYYQWGEVMQYQETPVYQDICPPGWHVSTAAEWDNLIISRLGNGIAGSSLKDTLSSNDFHGLLKGILYENDTWNFGTGANTGSMYWTADAGLAAYATARGLNFYNLSVSLYSSSRANAFPVRCVRN